MIPRPGNAGSNIAADGRSRSRPERPAPPLPNTHDHHGDTGPRAGTPTCPGPKSNIHKINELLRGLMKRRG